MAHKEVINISTIFSADIANVNNGIKTIRQNLDTLKLPSGLEKNFLNLLSKLDTEMSNFEAKTKDGLGSKLDSRALEKSGRNILELYRQLQVQVKALGTLSNSEFKKMFPDSFGDNIAKSTKALSDYAKETKKTTGEIQKQSDALAELQKKQKNIEGQAATLSKKKANTTDAAYNILSGQTRTARTSATKASNRELEAQRQIEVAKDSGAKVTKAGNLDARVPANRELIESLKQAQEEAKKTMTVYEDLRQKLSASIPPSQIDDEQQKIQNELNKTKSSIDEVKQTLSGLESSSASSFEELKATLSEITGLDFSNIKQGEEGFQQLANAISSIQTGVIDDLKGKIDQLENSTEGVAPAIENIKDGMEDAGKAVDDLTRREEDIGRLKAQILDFFSIGNAIQLFKRAVTSALETVKDLDAAMTETAVVTEFNVGDMWSQLPQYTKRANELGVSIKGAYEAATLYYQQGLKTNQVIGVSNETLKMARIANIEAADATDLMTAALRGFNMAVNEANARNVNDVYSNLAAITAADTEEIGIAMSKTASIAKSANMEFNTTAALLSQIIETTREAPETAGTAMKTIIARFTEVKKLISEGDLIGADEEGEVIDVNKIDTALKTVGISLKGFLQGTEGIDDIFLKLASKWNTLDISTQRYIATMAAGSRQQSRFLAMMGDYDRTMELVGEANNSAGASQQQFEKTLASMESKLAKLKNAWDEFVMGLANNDILKFGVDTLTLLLNTVNSLLKAFSSSQPMIKTFLTGLLAVGAFKLGKSALGVGKSGGFLGNLSGKGKPETEAGQIGERAGRSFTTNFKKQVTNIKSKGLIKGLFETKDIQLEKGVDFSKVYASLDDAQKVALSKNKNFKKAFLDQISSSGFEQAQQIEIKTAFDKGGIDSAIKKVDEFGGSIKVTEDMSNQASETIGTDFDNIANAAGAAGMAIMGVVSVMESMGVSDEAVNVVRGLGMALMALPVIFNVVKIAAKIFGKSVTATFASIPIIGWIAIAISGLIALGSILSSVIETSAEKMKRLSEETDRAKQAAESATNAYSELRDSLSGIDEANKTLDNLVYGTQAWTEALLKVNEQILNLITLYPQLMEYVTTGEHGQLEIDAEGTEKLLKQQLEGVQNAQQGQLIATAKETQPKAQDDRDIILTSIDIIQREVNITSEEIFDEISSFAKNNPLEMVNIANEEYSDAIYEAAAAVGLSVDGFANVAKKIQSFDKTWGDTEAQVQSSIGNIIRMDLSEASKQSRYTNQVINGLSAGYSENIEQDVTDKKNTLKGRNSETNISSLAKELQGQGYKITSTGKSLETYQQVFSALSGNTIESIKEADYSKDDLATLLAQIQLGNEYAANTEEIIVKIDQLAVTNKAAADKAAAILSNDFSSLTKDQIGELQKLETGKNLKQQLVEWGVLSANATQEELNDFLGKLGVANFNELNTKIQETADGTLDQFSNLISDNFIGENAKKADKLIQGKTYGEATSITDALKLAEGLGGDDAFNTLSSIISQLDGANIEPEKYQLLMESLSSYDFSDPKQVKAFLESIKEIAPNLSIEQVESWGESLIGAYKAVKTFSLENLKDELKSTLDLIDDIRGRDSLRFNDEEYQQLISAGADENNFVWDGQSWTYVGGTMESLASAIENNTNVTLENTIAILKNQIESGKGFNEGLSKLRDGINDDYDDTFAKGDLTDANEIARMYGLMNIDTIADTKTGESINIQDLLSTDSGPARLIELYKAQAKDAANVIANENKLESAESTTGMAGIAGETAAIIAQAEKAGLNPAEMMEYAAALQSVNEGLSDVTAAEVALSNSQMNAGLGEIIDSYDEWSAVIDKDTGKLKDVSAEGVATYNKLKASVNKMLNTSKDLSESFWENADNMKNIKKAAEGDTKALGELQKAAAKDYVLNIDTTGFSEDMLTALDDLANLLSNTELPTLEPGIDLSDVYSGTGSFIDSCNEMIRASGMTGEQVANAFKNLGYDVDIDYEEAMVKVPQYTTKTSSPVVSSDGSTSQTSQTTLTGYEEMPGLVPVVTSLTSTGSGGGGVSLGNQSAGKGNAKKGGGGGGGGSKKKETWENPYDELYNLTEKVNESLRQREKIERDYDRLLKNRMSTSKQILANSLKEIAKLREEIALQKQLQAGRKKQINKLGSETFKDEEGNEKSFSAWGVTKYASYDEKTGTIKIDWEGIDKITDTEKGGAVEAYISKLEELSEQFEETQDTIEDMEDIVREIQERGKTEYVDFEQRIYDALVAKDQEVIDNLSEINDSVNNSNARLLDSIQTAVDEQRRARERDEQRSDIEEKQRRLALLRSDTSGANALEIKKLEEEIGDLQQSYTDSLVDDSLAQLQQQNDDAAEQRERQIEIMQNQLDYAAKNGAYWEEVSNLLSTAFNPDGSLNNNSALIGLLKETEGFKALSEFGGMQWIDELIESWLVAQEGLANWKVEKAKQSTTGVKTQNAGTLKYNSSTGLWNDSSGGTYSTLAYDPATGQYKASGYTPKASTPAPTPTSGNTNPYGKASATSGNIKSGAKGNAVKAIQYALNKLGYGNSGTKSVDGIFGSSTASAVKAFQKATGISADGIVGTKTREKFKVKGYLKGGLADYTGPAWMDGTPSKPELVLDAKDTQNFIVLKNILADVFEGRNGISEKSGDNYFEIHIEVDKLENDYDVEQVAEKVKRIVNEDARYRNVNAINLLR